MHIIKDTTASNMILKSEVSVQNASVSKVHWKYQIFCS
jgi:hypothetical protein